MTPKGYWIVHITVTDAARYPEYVAADSPVIASFGGTFLVRAGRYEAPEGNARERHVVIEFPSYAAALACYRSPAYQAAARLRQAYAQSELVIVEGFSG
jgi:uncharacterized protein (DUF1330 family)